MCKDAFHVFVESLRRATPPRRRARGLKLKGYKIMSHDSHKVANIANHQMGDS